MATDTEKREIEILLNAQQANASIKDMAAGVALMNNQLAKMGQDDPRREQLQRDFQVLGQRVAAARAEMRTYVKTEEELRAEAEQLNRENQQVILNGQKVAATFNEMDKAGKVLEAQLKDLAADDPGRKKLLADYQALQERIEGVKKEMGSAKQESGFFKQALGNAFAFATGGGIEVLADKVIDLGKDIFETTAKFETYETVMTTALGDRSKAQQSMRDIQEMAAKTPFSVEELTGSFIKFVNRGLNPSMAEMTKLADLAASQGKSFDQLAEAVLDAGGGEFERLKEFGLKASKSGDQVTLSFKGVNQTVKNTPEAINGAIMAFGSMQGVAGSTAAISKTLEGQWSNLGDTAGQLEIKIGGGLKPLFTFLLSLISSFVGWIGRFVDEAAPLKSLFTDLIDVASGLYREVGDVLEGLGLFSSKTDTVKLAVEALRFVLTLILLPIKTLYQASQGVVDLFVEWYNKSELLRGVLGGLGAVVVSLFTTIKDDALKILGGVGDILVGIFTLDKNKLIAGFKSALAATADVALAAGDRAANQFAKGYLANKDNHITRTKRGKASSDDEGAAPAGEKLTSDSSAGDAAAEKKAEAAAKKAQAARDKAAREHLAGLKKWVKEEGDLLESRDVLSAQRMKVELTRQGQLRQDAEDRIIESAKNRLGKLTGLESDYTDQVLTIQQERGEQLQGLHAKWAEEDEKNRQKDIDEQIQLNEAQSQEQLAYYQLQLADKLLLESSYNELVYQEKQAAKERELALLKQKYGEESAEYKKLNAEKIKEQAAHLAKSKKTDDDFALFKQRLSKAEQLLNSDNAKFLEESLGKQTLLYKAFQLARKAAALARIEVDLVQEIQGYWASAAEAGPAGTIWAGIQSGLAVVRAGFAVSQLEGFAKGGPTGEGMQARRPGGGMLDVMGTAMGLSVGGNGKLVDGDGLEVAGLVHRDEYVIPAWLREDPQVLQVENWLEARRQRGFYTGGTTTEGDTRAADVVGQAELGGSTAQLVQVLASLDQRLQKVEEWPTQLEVVLDLLQLEREQEKVRKVKASASISSK